MLQKVVRRLTLQLETALMAAGSFPVPANVCGVLQAWWQYSFWYRPVDLLLACTDSLYGCIDCGHLHLQQWLY